MADKRSPSVAELIEAGRDREAAELGVLLHPSQLNGELMDPVSQLALLAPLLGGVVANITDDELDRPTPCTEYTVRGVLEHMIGGATAFAAAYRGEAAGEPEMGDVLANFGPALSSLGEAIGTPGALDRTVAAPFGDVPGEAFARYVVLDGLVHGWDLATATGQAYDPPDELVAAAEDYARETIEPLRNGQAFGDEVAPAADASPIERLAAYTGRRPLRTATH